MDYPQWRILDSLPISPRRAVGGNQQMNDCYGTRIWKDRVFAYVLFLVDDLPYPVIEWPKLNVRIYKKYTVESSYMFMYEIITMN